MSILSKQDILDYAPELDLSAYTDATISGMLNRATNQASSFCGVSGFDYQTVTDETDRAYISNDGELMISVRRRPIVSVSAISLTKGGFSTSLVLTNPTPTGNVPLYQIPTPGNKLVFPNSYFYLTGTYLAGGSSQLFTLRGAKMFYKMTYTGGYQVIPDDLKEAIMLYFRDIYSRQFNVQNLTSFTQGSYSESKAQLVGGKTPLVQMAEGILMAGGYKRLEF